MAEYYQPISERKPEVCIVEVPSIVIVIETGFGYYTYPMLVIETKMNAEIRDWSSDVCLSLLFGGPSDIMKANMLIRIISFHFSNTDFD